MRTAREIWDSRNPQHECGNDGKDLFYKTMEMCMQEYAEEYHQSELLKLNKSDVISSVCTCKVSSNLKYKMCPDCLNKLTGID